MENQPHTRKWYMLVVHVCVTVVPSFLYRMVVSQVPDSHLLAAVIQPGSLFHPKGNKLIRVFDWMTCECIQTINTGMLRVTISVLCAVCTVCVTCLCTVYVHVKQIYVFYVTLFYHVSLYFTMCVLVWVHAYLINTC